MNDMAVISALVLSFCLSCWAAPADAYERGRPSRSDQPWEEFIVNFGLYLTTFNSDVTLAGTRGRSRPEYRGPPRPGYNDATVQGNGPLPGVAPPSFPFQLL